MPCDLLTHEADRLSIKHQPVCGASKRVASRMPCFRKSQSMPIQVHPNLEALEDVMTSLYQAVDSRVYVSVGRGLWDCSSQDVYEYLEGLQEGLGHNKVQPL